MNLTLDIGNTAVKWATFEGHSMVESGRVKSEELRVKNEEWKGIDHAIVCASGDIEKVKDLLSILNSQFSSLDYSNSSRCSVPLRGAILNSSTPLPIKLDYKTPETLGADRVADACGAVALHPSVPCLVIDAGTCITVDFVDANGTYHGGAIMPGLGMNLQALHTFTAKLPLINIQEVCTTPVLGRSTEESIVAGTLGATLLALAGFVALYKEKAPGLQVLLTGGDAERLMAQGSNGWEHVPHLTLIGLNEIMLYNEK